MTKEEAKNQLYSTICSSLVTKNEYDVVTVLGFGPVWELISVNPLSSQSLTGKAIVIVPIRSGMEHGTIDKRLNVSKFSPDFALITKHLSKIYLDLIGKGLSYHICGYKTLKDCLDMNASIYAHDSITNILLPRVQMDVIIKPYHHSNNTTTIRSIFGAELISTDVHLSTQDRLDWLDVNYETVNANLMKFTRTTDSAGRDVILYKVNVNIAGDGSILNEIGENVSLQPDDSPGEVSECDVNPEEQVPETNVSNDTPSIMQYIVEVIISSKDHPTIHTEIAVVAPDEESAKRLAEMMFEPYLDKSVGYNLITIAKRIQKYTFSSEMKL